MQLTRVGQLIDVTTRKIENVLDFDNGSFTLAITDDQYLLLLNFLESGKKKQEPKDFYINEENVKLGHEEDGVDQV